MNKTMNIQTKEQKKNQIQPVSLNRFFDEAFKNPFNILSLFNSKPLSENMVNFPKVDVIENDNEISVVANIPGMDPEKIDIEVGDDYLSLSGTIEKENKMENKREKTYRYEREVGEFRRDFMLPARVNKDKIVARAKNGVLTIVLPKTEEERKSKVRVEIDK